MSVVDIKTEDGKIVHEGDRVYDYYTMKAGIIVENSITMAPDPWFTVLHDADPDGKVTSQLLNGARICSMEYAADHCFQGAVVEPTDDPMVDWNGHLDETWLLRNLPEGWSYDCVFGVSPGFIVGPKEDLYDEKKRLLIPLGLLK